ncbi:MAG: efflux RND transporter periplasmic adaptor subunit [Phycisphaerales bacterium]|nr:efflux RND transporter periplasmic adaptor subunit [Phycisphaerales bacterium]
MSVLRHLFFTLLLVTPALQGCDKHPNQSAEHASAGAEHGDPGTPSDHAAHGEHAVWLTTPARRDVTITQEYVGRIRSCRHVDIRPLAGGYLEPITVKEGQRVKAGDLLFKIFPAAYQARVEAERAEAEAARIECANARKLVESNVISAQELSLAEAKLAQAEARVRLAEVELGFTSVRAPFDGIIDRFEEQHGSLVDEGDVLTTISDNSVMWVYFNVPEARYLEYVAAERDSAGDQAIELLLANGQKFPERGSIGAIEADFDNETGNIAFRADFQNPTYLLRNGQTGKVLMNRIVRDAIVIPQRATFSVLAKRYVYVVGEDGIVRQREIAVDRELEDIFVIRDGLADVDRIVLEGVAQVRDGQKLEHYEIRPAEEALSKLKFYAE